MVADRTTPAIVILSNGSSMEACIDDEMYDVRR